MANAYEIPWAPPDIGPAASLFVSALNQNRANDRSDEYLAMERDAMRANQERASHEDLLKEEARKRQQAIESWNAMPAIVRAAHRSVGMANANPYGIKFEEEQGQTPSLRASGINVMGGNDQYAQHAAKALLGQPAEPQAIDPTIGQHSGAPAQAAQYGTPVTNEPGEPPHDEATEGEGGIEKAQELLSQPSQRRLFASYQGQRFEVPEQKDTTGLGQEYDEMYQGLIEAGEDPKLARKYVVAQYKTDTTQNRIADRTADQITARHDEAMRSRADVAQQDEWRRLQREQSEKNARIGGGARVAAAAPALKADAANARDMSVLRQQGTAIRSTAQFSKLAAADKTLRGVMINIASGTVPLQHADAQVSLARIFRQAQPTEGEMHMLYNNLGGTRDKWNQFVARMETGDLSTEQLRQLRIAAKAVAKEHGEDKQRFVSVARHMLGPGSGFENMPDQAQALYEGMAAELGIEGLPSLYATEGGVSLGSGKRPTTQPRGTKPGILDELMGAIK